MSEKKDGVTWPKVSCIYSHTYVCISILYIARKEEIKKLQQKRLY